MVHPTLKIIRSVRFISEVSGHQKHGTEPSHALDDFFYQNPGKVVVVFVVAALDQILIRLNIASQLSKQKDPGQARLFVNRCDASCVLKPKRHLLALVLVHKFLVPKSVTCHTELRPDRAALKPETERVTCRLARALG